MLSEFENKTRLWSTVDLLEGPEEVQQGQVHGPVSGTCWPCAIGQDGVVGWRQLVATSCPQNRSVHLQQGRSTTLHLWCCSPSITELMGTLEEVKAWCRACGLIAGGAGPTLSLLSHCPAGL